MIIDILRMILWGVGLALAMGSLSIAIKIWNGNRLEYRRNSQRTQSFLKALRGEIPTDFDGVQDFRVAAGIAIDRKTNQWVEQGRLSDEAVSDIFRAPRH